MSTSSLGTEHVTTVLLFKLIIQCLFYMRWLQKWKLFAAKNYKINKFRKFIYFKSFRNWVAAWRKLAPALYNLSGEKIGIYALIGKLSLKIIFSPYFNGNSFFSGPFLCNVKQKEPVAVVSTIFFIHYFIYFFHEFFLEYLQSLFSLPGVFILFEEFLLKAQDVDLMPMRCLHILHPAISLFLSGLLSNLDVLAPK